MDKDKVYKIKLAVGENEKYIYDNDIEFDSYDEEFSYLPITVKVVEIDIDKDIEKIVAYFEGLYFDVDYINEHNESIFNILDMINVDTCGIYENLFESDGIVKDEYISMCDNFFYLDRIYVNKEYRNRGFAKLLLNKMDEIIRKMARLDIGLIVTCCQNFESVDGEEKMIRDNKELKQKLISLYENTGFKRTNSDIDSIYLVKMIDFE